MESGRTVVKHTGNPVVMSEAKKSMIKDILLKAKEIWDDGELEEVHQKYRNDELPPMLPHWHKILVGRAHHLIRLMMENGATKEELIRALKYFVVCMDAEKYRLDIPRYKLDNGINGLRKKYADIVRVKL